MKTHGFTTLVVTGALVATGEQAWGHAHGHGEVKKVSWDEVEQETLLPGLLRQYVYGEEAMFVRFEFEKGSKVPMHSHPNEQITFVEKGKMRFEIGEKEMDLDEGDVVVIPANLPHGGEVLEDTIEFDIFAPPRMDWITGQDFYFGAKKEAVKGPYETKGTLPESEIEIVAQFDFRPGNLAVLPDGRVVFSVHPMGEPQEFKVLELQPDGTTKPFPNAEYASPLNEETGIGFDDVIGIESDQYGTVWMVDMGAEGRAAKLLAWDTRKNKLRHSIAIPKPVMQENSFMQDLAIDLKNGKVYLADMTMAGPEAEISPAIVSVDLRTGQSRRVLYGHESLNPEKDALLEIDGNRLAAKNGAGKMEELQLALNPISIDPQNEWVYFGAVNSDDLYRIPAAVLADDELTADEVRAKVERYGAKEVSDGIVAGADGKVYVTAVNKDSIYYTDGSGESVKLAGSPSLSWPDGLSVGPDGMIYATVNQLGRVGAFNGGEDRTKAGEFYIVRMKPAGEVSIGR